MDRETYERQKPFAGTKKPSMLRRCVGHDYSERQMYMVTMVTENRRPLFGTITGRSTAEPGAPDAPTIALTALGKCVESEWMAISQHHPEIQVVALQMMPDHLHGILFVKEKMEKPLGMALRGFKQSCNKHFRRLILGQTSVPSVALPTQQTQQLPAQQAPNSVPSVALPTQQKPQRASRKGEDRTHGLLFSRGYNDRLLMREGQLDRWLHYLQDNPRRLLMKREHPDLFRVQRNLHFNSLTFSAIGNRFLLQRPVKLQVQCSRSLTEEQIKQQVESFLSAARRGSVLVSPSISPGEKAIMRAAFNEGLPLILLQENGFTELAKPSGKRMEACAKGQLLILAAWEHHNEQTTIRRDQCISLNAMARLICSD